MRLFEILSLTFHDVNRDYHHGQSDQTLNAYVGKQRVGYIDYSVYQGEPHVQMIDVMVKRKGYGTALVLKLQSMFPDIEMNMGMLTGDGDALLKTIPQTIVPNQDYQEKADRLKQLQAKEAGYMKLADAFHENPTDAGRTELHRLTAEWNDMNDEVWQLEQELHSMKPAKRIFGSSE